MEQYRPAVGGELLECLLGRGSVRKAIQISLL
jgi:hypothetical protein